MRKAVIAGIVLVLATPAQAKKFKPSKATEAELLEELTRAQAPDQLLVLDELEKRQLATACPALAERNRIDDAAGVRARSLQLMAGLDCPNLLDAAVLSAGGDKHAQNRLAALDIVRAEGSDKQVGLLLSVLQNDKSVQVRHKALTLAIETGWEGTAPLLATALRDDYTVIVQDAAVVLLAAQHAESRQALYEEIPTLKPAEREAVMTVWQDHPMPGDKGYLLATLDDSHTPVAVSAAVALGKLGDPSVLPVLQEKQAREKDKAIRKALGQAIKALES